MLALGIKDTSQIFNNDEEKEAVISRIFKIFGKTDVNPERREQKFGILPGDWSRSLSNPVHVKKIQDKLTENVKTEKSVDMADMFNNFMVSKMVLIHHDGAPYLMFKFLVTFNCLISSYLYVYLAAFRLVDSTLQDDPNILLFSLVLVFEMLFTLDIIAKFMLTYENPETRVKVVDLGTISKNYFFNKFLWDFIPLMPLQIFKMYRNRNTLFYLIKLIRLYQGFKILDIPKLMGIIKKLYRDHSEEMIQ